MSLPENQCSIKMKKINTLNEKIKPFRQYIRNHLGNLRNRSVGSIINHPSITSLEA
jgi:hypothetical protein